MLIKTLIAISSFGKNSKNSNSSLFHRLDKNKKKKKNFMNYYMKLLSVLNFALLFIDDYLFSCDEN